MKTKTPVADRFWVKVERRGPDECWPWKAQIDGKGYGRLRVGNRMRLASRVSFELAHGTPGALLVCHKCDNPTCVNPGHLFLGSYQANSDDMRRKGRERKALGESNGFSKLTDAQVKEIRESSLSLRAMARKLGVTYGHVGKVRRQELRK